LDGHAIGKATKYDGFPSYLWLREGKYELVFYLDGYETMRKDIEIFADVTVREHLTMVRGETTPVEEVSTASKREPEPRSEIRQRGPDARPHVGDRDGAPRRFERSVEGSRVIVKIMPSDAAVYLDGRYLGTANAVNARKRGISLKAGTHTLQVVRPDYQTEDLEFTLEADERIELQIELKPES
jgi:hypothetical protein